MLKVRSVISLVFLSIFIAGCDKGGSFLSQDVPSKLRVLVERQIYGSPNQKMVVYAMDFRKEGNTLTFVCPCHISSGQEESLLNVRVEGDSFKLALLPGADYNIDVQYWALESLVK
jgi:hypothetical protein